MEEELFYMYTSYSSALDDARMNRGLIIPLRAPLSVQVCY
jgi:hypothetical protein